MSKTLLILAASLALRCATSYGAEPPTAKAWLVLQKGVTSNHADKRANAVHALRLLSHNLRAQSMAENALSDSSSRVRAAAARSLGLMGAVPALPKLKAALNDKEPAVVLAAARSLFLLGERQDAYEIDYEVLTGERKSAHGFVASQIDGLRDPMAVAKMGIETGIGFAPFGGEAYEVYKRISQDDTTPVRVAAAKELATDREPKISAALAKACSDKNWRVRLAAVFAIAKRDDPALLPLITAALDDKSGAVRYEAAATVLRLSGKVITQ